MASPEQQIKFLSNLQRLLAEGSFVSTYKYALLLSLADLRVEHGRDDDAPLEIPTRRIGEKFAEYYWRQCAPYLPAGGAGSGTIPLKFDKNVSGTRQPADPETGNDDRPPPRLFRWTATDPWRGWSSQKPCNSVPQCLRR